MADPIETARQHDEAFNAQDAEGRRAIEARDIEAVLPGGLVLHGPDQTLRVVMAFWEALPDARIVADNQFVAGETVVAEGTSPAPTRAPSVLPRGMSRRAATRSGFATHP